MLGLKAGMNSGRLFNTNVINLSDKLKLTK